MYKVFLLEIKVAGFNGKDRGARENYYKEHKIAS